MTPLLTRGGRREQKVWHSPGIGFVAETGTHVAITALGTIFSLLFPNLLLALFISFFPITPLFIYAGTVRYFVLPGACTSCMIFYFKYVF